MNTQDRQVEEGLSVAVERSVPGSTGLLAKVIKLAIFAVVLVFVVRELTVRLATVSWSEIEIDFVILFPAILLKTFGLFFIGLVYHLLVGSHRRGVSWLNVFAVTFVSRMGKYLPGKFASTAGAVWLFHREGLPVALATRVTLMAQGLMVVMGLLTAVPLAIFWSPVYDRLPLAWLWCGVLIVVGVICLHPKVFCKMENFILAKLGQPRLTNIGRMRDYVGPIAVLLACQLISGLTLWLIVRSVTVFEVGWLPLCISAVALAGSVGLLALFAPGGLGVREWILLVILSPVAGAGISAIVVVLARVVSTLVELAVAGVGLVLLRKARQRRARL